MTVYEETLLSWRYPMRTAFIAWPRPYGVQPRPLYRGQIFIIEVVYALVGCRVNDFVIVGETEPGVVRFHVLPTSRSATADYDVAAMRRSVNISPPWLTHDGGGLPLVVRDLAEWVRVDPNEFPQCLVHDDCAEVPAIGCACWRDRHGGA